MSSRTRPFTVHPSIGGLNNSADPTALDPGELVVSENVEYLEGGQRRKRLGTSAYSTTAMVSSTTNVRAVADLWSYGASLTSTQHFVAVAGASIFRSTGGGTASFTAITTTSSFGTNGNTTTNITIAADAAIISDGASIPVQYNQSTTLTTTSTFVFTASAYHLRRIFGVGLSTAPSQTRFSAAGGSTDFVGADSGNFFLNEGDGDSLVGISQPFHKRLYFFKGQQKGSVWELTGTTPGGFALDKVTTGAPAINNQAIITTANDIYWISRYGVHSLEVTAKYGDTQQAFLSLPIQRTFRNDLALGRLNQAWGFWHPLRNIVGWFVVPSGQTVANWALVYNYALSDPMPGGKKYWSIWTFTAFSGYNGAVMLTPAGQTNPAQPRLYIGAADGRLQAAEQSTLSDDGATAYTARVRTPIITKIGDFPETQEKQFYGVVTYFVPKGAYSANLDVTIDRRTQSVTVDLTGQGDTLG